MFHLRHFVNEAVRKLAPDGADPSPFVQHAARVQEQLTRLHAQLQRAQEPQDPTISSIQDPPTMPLTRAQKRFAACDDDIPAQETKRKRLDSAGSARPCPNTPPSTSDNKANPKTKAPTKSMSLGSRTTDIRSDPKHAEPRRADSVGSSQALRHQFAFRTSCYGHRPQPRAHPATQRLSRIGKNDSARLLMTL